MAKKAAVSKTEELVTADTPPVKKRATRVSPTALAARRKATEVDKPVTFGDMYNRVIEKNRKKGKLVGYNVMSGGGDTFQLGIRIPFALQYLLGSEVLPMGVAIETNGPPMSCKTMLMYEFARFFKEASGYFDMILTEGKVSQELVRSVVGWDDSSRRATNIVSVPTMNAMMREISNRISWITQVAEKGEEPTSKAGLGYVAPFLIGVDSVMGANASETSAKIQKEGDVGRSFPVEALILTPFLKETAARITNFPFVLFLINHRKESEKDPSKPYDPVKFTKPGGKQLRFQASYELVTHLDKRGWQTPDPRPNGGAEIEHRLIRIDNGKNSAATDGRHIKVRVSWRSVITDKLRADGVLKKVSRQLTKWHWDEAIPPLLTSWKKGNKGKDGDPAGEKARQAKLDTVLHIRTAPGGRYYSDTLGVPKEKAIDASRMGKLISDDEQVLEGLRALFGISDGYIWAAGPGADYRRIRLKLKKHADGAGAAQIDKSMKELSGDALKDDEELEEELAEFSPVDVDVLVEQAEATWEEMQRTGQEATEAGSLKRGRRASNRYS